MNSRGSKNSASHARRSFRLARADQKVFVKFIDDLVFGSDRKAAVMQPIPFGAGPLKFTIERNKSGEWVEVDYVEPARELVGTDRGAV